MNPIMIEHDDKTRPVMSPYKGTCTRGMSIYKDHKTGWLIKVGDSCSFAQSLRQLVGGVEDIKVMFYGKDITEYVRHFKCAGGFTLDEWAFWKFEFKDAINMRDYIKEVRDG